MNVFVLAIIGIAIFSVVIFGIFMTGENPIIKLPIEHYEIEITGLKDSYRIGEQYSFSYILSGFGTPCGGISITFPINKTDSMNDGFIPSCVESVPTDFVLDIEKTYGTRYGHVTLEETGNYTVTVQFEKGVNGPTTVKKSFMIINP